MNPVGTAPDRSASLSKVNICDVCFDENINSKFPVLFCKPVSDPVSFNPAPGSPSNPASAATHLYPLAEVS